MLGGWIRGGKMEGTGKIKAHTVLFQR